jgi:hypothetical protein
MSTPRRQFAARGHSLTVGQALTAQQIIAPVHVEAFGDLVGDQGRHRRGIRHHHRQPPRAARSSCAARAPG